MKDKIGWKRLLLAGGIALILAWLYLYGALAQWVYVNTGMTATDQSAYLHYSQRLYDDPLHIDGARMPLYPFLMRLFYAPGMSDQTFFELGKTTGIGISVIALAGLGLVFYRFLPPLLATNLLLITAFTVYMFKAAYFQPEILFYTLNFFSFVLMCRMFVRPSARLAVLTGVVLGLAMLTKASVSTGLALFVFFILARALFDLLRRRGQGRAGAADRGAARLAVRDVALVTGVFLVLLAGYMVSSKRIFGTLFYNVNTNFYMWYDTWEDAGRGTRAHGDRVGWPDMPAEELPSLGKYLAEHRPRQILNRVIDGLEVSYRKHCGDSFGYCKYVFIYLGAAALVGISSLSLLLRTTVRKHAFLILFVAAFIVANVLLSAWWIPISASKRFMLATFLPFIFVTASVLALPGLRLPTIRLRGRVIHLMTAFHLAVLALVATDIYSILTSRIFILFGGD